MPLPPVLTRNLRLPAVAAPMFLISKPKLVIAQSTAGVVGAFPTLNARSTEILRGWLDEITMALAEHDERHPEAPAASYAANLIVHRSNDRLAEDLAAIVDYRVPIVITSLGLRDDVIEAVHSYGGIVLHDVINDRFARKAIGSGCDGLIALAAGAGGHARALSPFALINEIRAWFDGPLLLSGAIAHGRSVLGAQAAGADLAYIGSAFIATDEADAVEAYKAEIVQSAAADIVYTNLFTGVHGNYLRGSIVAAGLDPDDLGESDPSTMDFGSGGNTDAKAWRDIWGSGQGIGAVRAVVPVASLVDRLAGEYVTATQQLARTISGFAPVG
ncbi:NAD(P)H-dependent flavin oxidoreductase [Nocardia cyriacigeorgica]|uniref:NAD(P)H-dependent flavin oxidoreductase n=1 Tax=Nocardia cyriacigeorgica TaxID=135487 RepID=UPI00245758EB|nr:nitronate monooxygenase family protein [Nocardia cyriacigeorgica]